MMFFCLLELASCEMTSEIDFETIDKSKWIVINGYLSSTEGVNAVVKSTVMPHKPKASDTLTGAGVWLYENGQKAATLYHKRGHEYYLPIDSFNFKRNVAYSIQASAPGYTTAQTIDQKLISQPIPDVVRIAKDSLSSRFTLYFDFENTTSSKYYTWDYIRFGERYTGINYDTGITPKYFYNSKGFDNKITIEISPIRNDVDSLQLTFFHLSDDYASFLESFWNYDISYGDFSYETQYTVESQVKNGFGYFASYEKKCVTWINNNKNEPNKE